MRMGKTGGTKSRKIRRRMESVRRVGGSAPTDRRMESGRVVG